LRAVEGAAVMKNNSSAGTKTTRYSELKAMLEERRRDLQAEVQGKMRDVRAEGTWGGKQNEVFDAVESSEADIQDEIEFALIQMKSETLNKVNDALMRLEQGDYGNCFECGEEIAEKLRKSACARCRSQSAAKTVKRPGRSRSSASVSSPHAAAPRPSSSTCKIPASPGAPPVAEPLSLPTGSAPDKHPMNRRAPPRSALRLI
jgi:DnaK suppressor protein